jgi:ribosomal protein S18 acetylase RimI-like enzyme
MSNHIIIREMQSTDPPVMAAAFRAQGWNKPESQYLQYLQEHLSGERIVLLAEVEQQPPLLEFSGYLTIVWESEYSPFRKDHIPEIVDFNVLIKYRRQGIGKALMDEAEKRIALRSPVAGIGVGLTPDYGPAHILYIKRGYIPDGRGLFFNNHHLQWGETCIVNDELTLNFTKDLR